MPRVAVIKTCTGHWQEIIALTARSPAVLTAQACRDVLAVGYGPQHFAPLLPGCVALWSQRNPARPLWAFSTASGEGRSASTSLPATGMPALVVRP